MFFCTGHDHEEAIWWSDIASTEHEEAMQWSGMACIGSEAQLVPRQWIRSCDGRVQAQLAPRQLVDHIRCMQGRQLISIDNHRCW